MTRAVVSGVVKTSNAPVRSSREDRGVHRLGEQFVALPAEDASDIDGKEVDPPSREILMEELSERRRP